MERTLSGNEAKVVLDLEGRGQSTVTLPELRQAVGASDAYARYLAHRLVAKGWLARLRPGLYQLVPASRGREGAADTDPLAAGAVLAEPYFFSFGTACAHHGLTGHAFAQVYVACQARRRPETIRGTRYVFVQLPAERFFGFGSVSVRGVPVQMATQERALLDAIDRPRHAGGIVEVSGMVGRAAARISWKNLLELARRWHSSAFVQRLGYLLDLNGAEMPARTRSALLELVQPRSKILLGSRARWGTTGKLVAPWNVVENISPDLLLSPTKTGPYHRTRHQRSPTPGCAPPPDTQ